jgi:hypothetical protein
VVGPWPSSSTWRQRRFNCTPNRLQVEIPPGEEILRTYTAPGKWSRSSAHSSHFGKAEVPEVTQRQEFGVTGRLHVAEAAVAPADQRVGGAGGVNCSKSAGIGGNS